MFDLLVKIFGGWKTWGVTVFIASMIASFWDLIILFFQSVFSKIISLVGSMVGQDAITLQFQGVTAYFMLHLKFAECLAVILSVYLMKFLVRKIPFIKW